MRRVVIDMQNALFADAVAESLRRFDPDFDPVISDSPDKTLFLCDVVLAYVLIDNFIYGSVSSSYLSAVIDVL